MPGNDPHDHLRRSPRWTVPGGATVVEQRRADDGGRARTAHRTARAALARTGGSSRRTDRSANVSAEHQHQHGADAWAGGPASCGRRRGTPPTRLPADSAASSTPPTAADPRSSANAGTATCTMPTALPNNGEDREHVFASRGRSSGPSQLDVVRRSAPAPRRPRNGVKASADPRCTSARRDQHGRARARRARRSRPRAPARSSPPPRTRSRRARTPSGARAAVVRRGRPTASASRLGPAEASGLPPPRAGRHELAVKAPASGDRDEGWRRRRGAPSQRVAARASARRGPSAGPA